LFVEIRERRSTSFQREEDFAFLAAPQFPLCAFVHGASEIETLVAHDRENLDVGEAKALTSRWHDAGSARDMRPTLAVGIASDLDTGSDVCLGAELHPAQLIFNVGEGLENGAVLECVANAAATVAAMAACALVVSGGPFTQRTGRLDGLGLERTNVHERPHRENAERHHRPYRDLLARLIGRDHGRIGLRWRRTDRSGAFLAHDLAGGRRGYCFAASRGR